MWEKYIYGRIDSIKEFIYIMAMIFSFASLPLFGTLASQNSKTRIIGCIIAILFALSGFFGFMLYAFLPSQAEIRKLQDD